VGDAAAEFVAEGQGEVAVREVVWAGGRVDYQRAAGVFVEVGAADAAPVDGDCYLGSKRSVREQWDCGWGGRRGGAGRKGESYLV